MRKTTASRRQVLHTERLTVSARPDLARRVGDAAEREDTTKSVFIRQAILAALRAKEAAAQ
jgi:predicted transcriptional regulator